MWLWILFAVLSCVVIGVLFGGRLLASRVWALMIMGVVGGVSLAVYLVVGSPLAEGGSQAERLREAGRHPLAMAARLENEIASEPDHLDHVSRLKTLALIYWSVGDFEKMAEAYRRLRVAEPGDAGHQVGLAQSRILLRQGFVDEEAIGLLRGALGRDPEDFTALYLLSHAAIQEGREDRAAVLLRRAREIARREKQKEWIELIDEALDKL